jgi:hypothetical protein
MSQLDANTQQKKECQVSADRGINAWYCVIKSVYSTHPQLWCSPLPTQTVLRATASWTVGEAVFTRNYTINTSM